MSGGVSIKFPVGYRVRVISHHPQMGERGKVVNTMCDRREVQLDCKDSPNSTMWFFLDELGTEDFELPDRNWWK